MKISKKKSVVIFAKFQSFILSCSSDPKTKIFLQQIETCPLFVCVYFQPNQATEVIEFDLTDFLQCSISAITIARN